MQEKGNDEAISMPISLVKLGIVKICTMTLTGLGSDNAEGRGQGWCSLWVGKVTIDTSCILQS